MSQGPEDEPEPNSRAGSFGERALSGGRWGTMRSVVLQGGTLITTGVLARLLTTEEFGLVAISVVVVAMFDLITGVGLAASVIRRPSVDTVFLSTVFWASLGLGTGVAIAAVLLSEWSAALAGSPEAAGLVAVSALALPVGLCGSVAGAIMMRELRFRASTLIDILGTVVYGALAITLALLGAGPWSIVIGQLARSTAMAGAAFLSTGFRPSWRFDRSVLKSEWSFGLGVLGGDVVTYANRNADYWLVGNRLGPEALGVYYVAYVIPSLLRQRFNAVGHEVLYPLVSKFQTDLPRIVSAYLRVLKFVSFLVLPLMCGLAVVGDLAVRIGFGPGWEDAVTPLRAIALGAAITSVGVVVRPVFVAIGKPHILVRTGVMAIAAVVVGVLAIWDDLTVGKVAVVVAFAAAVEAIVAQAFVARLLHVSVSRQVRAVLPFAVAAAVMALGVLGARSTPFGALPLLPQALLAVALGGVLYLCTGFLAFRREFTEQVGTVRRFLGLG